MKPLALYLLKPGAPNCLNILGGGGAVRVRGDGRGDPEISGSHVPQTP